MANFINLVNKIINKNIISNINNIFLLINVLGLSLINWLKLSIINFKLNYNKGYFPFIKLLIKSIFLIILFIIFSSPYWLIFLKSFILIFNIILPYFEPIFSALNVTFNFIFLVYNYFIKIIYIINNGLLNYNLGVYTHLFYLLFILFSPILSICFLFNKFNIDHNKVFWRILKFFTYFITIFLTIYIIFDVLNINLLIPNFITNFYYDEVLFSWDKTIINNEYTLTNYFNISDSLANLDHGKINVNNSIKITDIFHIFAPNEPGSEIVNTPTNTNSGNINNLNNNISTPKPKPLLSIGSDVDNYNLSINKKTFENIINTATTMAKNIVPNLPTTVATGTAGAVGARVTGEIVKTLPISPLAKVGAMAGGAGLTAAAVAMGGAVGTSSGRNLREYLDNQIANSSYNNVLRDGRAPSPNREFDIHSMLDNFELNNWSFTLNIPSGGKSPLEVLLYVLFLALIIISVLFLYLAYLNIMQIFTNKHSSNIISYFNDPNKLTFMPIWFKNLFSKLITNFFNLHKTLYKYVIAVAILFIIFNLLLCLIISAELLTKVDQYVDVYQAFYRK